MSQSIALVGSNDKLRQWWIPLLEAGYKVDFGPEVTPTKANTLSLYDQFAWVTKCGTTVFVLPSLIPQSDSGINADESLLVISYRNPWYARGTPGLDAAQKVAALLKKRGLRMYQPSATGNG